MFPLLEAVPPAFSKPLPVGAGGGGTGGTCSEGLFKGPFEGNLGAGGGGGAEDLVGPADFEQKGGGGGGGGQAISTDGFTGSSEESDGSTWRDLGGRGGEGGIGGIGDKLFVDSDKTTFEVRKGGGGHIKFLGVADELTEGGAKLASELKLLDEGIEDFSEKDGGGGTDEERSLPKIEDPECCETEVCNGSVSEGR